MVLPILVFGLSAAIGAVGKIVLGDPLITTE